MKVERIFKSTALLAAFVLTASFGFAQNTADSMSFPAKNLPIVHEPTIYIGEIFGGKQTKEALWANPFVIAKCPKDEIVWNVLSYKVVFVANGKEEAPIRVEGAEFTEQVKSRIQSASSGTMIEFSDIRIQSTVGGTRTVVRPLIVRIQ